MNSSESPRSWHASSPRPGERHADSPAAADGREEQNPRAIESAEPPVRRPHGAGLSILIVEDNPDVGTNLAEALRTLNPGWRVALATDLERAVRCLMESRHSFDAAIVDLGLPDAEGDQAPRRLRDVDPRLAIVVLTGQTSDRTANALIDQGVQDYYLKGHISPSQIARSVRTAIRRQARQRTLEQAAHRDAVTGALNRHGFEEAFDRAVRLAQREGHKIGLVLCDLNRFKAVNDNFGHMVGDALLKGFADRVTATLRPTDALARVGGDEFAVLVNCVDRIEHAVAMAERVANIAGQSCRVGDRDFRLSASFGMAVYPDHGKALAALLETADAAMYTAKRQGRRLAVAET